MAGDVTWLRHALATLAYRFAKSVRDAPASFGDFHAGGGVRTPSELVRHLTALTAHIRARIAGQEPGAAPPPLDWPGEVARFHTALESVDALLDRHAPPPEEQCLVVLQGPLSDALTHVGQIAMLRRLAGSPVIGENFSRADVHSGRVGAEQPPPAAPFSRENP